MDKDSHTVTDFGTGLVCDGVLTGGSVDSVQVVVEVSLSVNEVPNEQVSGDPGKQCLAGL